MTTPALFSDRAMEAILGALNSAYAADPVAIALLCANRVQCNRALADHPTVQVGRAPVVAQFDAWDVSALGLLNGVVEAATGRRVCMVWEDVPDANGARRFIGFEEYPAEAIARESADGSAGGSL